MRRFKLVRRMSVPARLMPFALAALSGLVAYYSPWTAALIVAGLCLGIVLATVGSRTPRVKTEANRPSTRAEASGLPDLVAASSGRVQESRRV